MRKRQLSVTGLALGLLLIAAPALAQTPEVPASGQTGKSHATKERKAQKTQKAHAAADGASRPAKARFLKGSEESPAERDRRLTRECKGRPNAGACMGYAS